MVGTATPWRRMLHLGALSGINLGLNFLFQAYLILRLGAGRETDLYFAAIAVPQFLLAVLAIPLTSAIVPLFAKQDGHEADAAGWTLSLLAVIGFGALAVFLSVSASRWFPLLLPGFPADGMPLATRLVHLQMFSMALTGITIIQGAILMAKGWFRRAEVSQSIGLLAAFSCIWLLLDRLGIVAAALAVLVRYAVVMLVLGVTMGRPSFSPARHLGILREIWNKAKPISLGAAFLKSDSVVDRYLLSHAPSGELSIYYFAQQIYAALSQLFSRSIASPLVRDLSLLREEGESAAFRRRYRRHVLVAIGVAVLSTLLLCLGTVLARFVPGLPLGPSQLSLLMALLVALVGYLLGGMMGQVSTVAFYSRGETRIPVKIGGLAYAISLPLKIVSYWSLGIVGLALASSLYYLGSAIMQHRALLSRTMRDA